MVQLDLDIPETIDISKWLLKPCLWKNILHINFEILNPQIIFFVLLILRWQCLIARFFSNIFCYVPDMVYNAVMIYQICALTSLCHVSGGRVPRPVTNLSFRHNRKASYLRSQSVEERNETVNLEESSAGRCTTRNKF